MEKNTFWGAGGLESFENFILACGLLGLTTAPCLWAGEPSVSGLLAGLAACMFVGWRAITFRFSFVGWRALHSLSLHVCGLESPQYHMCFVGWRALSFTFVLWAGEPFKVFACMFVGWKAFHNFN